MRTTVTLTLDEALVTQAKEAALAAGTTLSGLVEAALRRALAEATVRVEAPPFKLVTFGGGGLLPGVDIVPTSALLDEEDIASFLRRSARDPA